MPGLSLLGRANRTVTGMWAGLPACCIELAKAYQDDTACPAWLQEFGATKRWMPKEDIPAFADSAVRAAAACTDLWGCTWWRSHDIHPRMQGFAAIEYDMGLLDTGNHPKPVALHPALVLESLSKKPAHLTSRGITELIR